MLKLLVRLTAVGVAAFLAVLSGIFISAGEDDYPWNTDHTSKLVFSDSPLEKQVAIDQLDALVDSSDLRLAKVVADPQNFLTSRSLYVFGSDASATAQDLAWFRPEMSGQLLPARDLGDAPLDGKYVYSGSPEALESFREWISDAGVQADVQVKTAPAVLAYALLNTGAVLPLLTSLVLLVSLAVSWYVLRARARTLKVLSGAGTGRIVSEDVVSLLKVAVPPALVTLAVSLAVVAASGRVAHLLPFAGTMLVFLAVAFLLMLVAALLITIVTWPSVEGIAARRPPERHFRVVSEVLKFATFAFVAVLLPAAGSAIASATLLSDQGARWELLNEQVSIRIGAATPEEFDDHVAAMDAMVQAAAARDVVTFSYSIDAAHDETLSEAGFDGMVLVNPAYLRAISPLVEISVSDDRPLGDKGTRVALEDLPESLSVGLKSSFELWNRAGRNLDGMAENFVTYTYTGEKTFPGLPPVAGEMHNLRNPLVVVITDPASTFTPDFLASTISSGNVMFSDSGWVRNYLESSTLRETVLAVDRISDGGLYSSQVAGQTASVRTLSYVLVVLALVVGVSVSAWIYALSRARRLFVQRTSGWIWARVLHRRMLWEGVIACVVASVVVATSNAGEHPDAWWALAAIPLYLLVSYVLHLSAVKNIFSRRLARVE